MNERAWIQARFSDIRPKAIAALTKQFRDLDMAEDLFGAACVKAIEVWPKKGLPDDPFAWLLTVGRNVGRDMLRRRAVAQSVDGGTTDFEEPEPNYIDHLDQQGLRDDVLRLFFVCCHPALSPQDQSALALRVVAGLSVDEIAGAFLVKPKAMEQRLTRAKKTIARANIPFDTPTLQERHTRFGTVLLMLYLLFNEGWSASSGDVHIKAPLCDEAVRLARLLLTLFPGMSELMGLLALFLFQHSRAAARLDSTGDLVPLDDQDRSLWDRSLIAEAQVLLEKALRHDAPGKYQIQAAIAGVHAGAVTPDATEWAEINRLYELLHHHEPTAIVKLNQAAALSKIDGPQAGLDLLDPLAEDLEDYRWYHAARGALFLELEHYEQARAAYRRALGLAPTAPEKRFLEEKIALCEKNL